MLIVMLVVSGIVFGGIVIKSISDQNVSVVESEINSNADEKKDNYKAVALIELAQIIMNGGHMRPIDTPNALISAYQNKKLKLSVVPNAPGNNPPNSLWISVVDENRSAAELLVKNTAKDLIASVREKEEAAKQNKNKQYVVSGTTRVAKYEVIEPEPEPEFKTKTLFKTAFLSLFIGMFASLVYAVIEKLKLDYRAKYPLV